MNALPRLAFMTAFAAMICLVPIAARADIGSNHPPTLGIPRLPAKPPFDAALDGAWSSAAVVHLGYDATDRTRAHEDTIVRIGRFAGNLYVAFDARQREPVEATQLTNGSGVLAGDAVMVHIWPNGLNGFAYWFAANPLGARDQYSSENSAYAPSWFAYGRRTHGGYIAILEIPLNALHLQKPADWRMQFHRIVVASNSNFVWELVPGQSQFIDARYGGRIGGLDDTRAAARRARLQIYGLGQAATPAQGGSLVRTGVDFSIPFAGTSALFGTVHPDFSNVETDQQSISPTEFARRYTEVRPFFTQAASNFGAQTDLNAPMSVLYTPAIPSFKNGLGAEGHRGAISYGAFSATGNGRDDSAVSLFASDRHQELTVGMQRVAVDTAAGGKPFRDLVDEESISYFNPNSRLTSFADIASETGTSVTSPSDAEYRSLGESYQTATTSVAFALQRMGAQFSPADGYADQPPGEPGIAGYTGVADKQFDFARSAEVLDAAVSLQLDRYHAPGGEVNQADLFDNVRVDFKDLISVTAMQGLSSLQTCVPLARAATCERRFLPYNSSGVMVQYAANTSHPSTLMYMTGAYYHGRLDSWLRAVSLPLSRRMTLILEGDDSTYVSSLPSEPDTSQWLERSSLSYQLDRAVSVDVGLRRIIGTEQPYAYAPLGSTATFTNATNLSAAFHYFQGTNELYVVYGNPNRLQTVPALYVKLIRYIGAGKGT